MIQARFDRADRYLQKLRDLLLPIIIHIVQQSKTLRCASGKASIVAAMSSGSPPSTPA